MTTLNITLPRSLRKFVEEEAKAGGYSTPERYVEKLLRQTSEQSERQRERRRLRKLIQEGLDSGPSQPLNKEEWEEIRREARQKLKERKRHGLPGPKISPKPLRYY